MAASSLKLRRSIQVSGAFDIETEDWSRFVYGGYYTPEDGYHDFSWRKEEDFVDSLLACQGTLWAHNGGRFDAIWLLGHVIKRELPCQVGLQGSRVASIIFGSRAKPRLIIRDSVSLVPMPLDDLAGFAGLSKAETDLPCVCGKRCGGYCSIRRDMSTIFTGRLRQYLEHDVTCTYQGLEALVAFADEHDIDLMPTVGSSAWKTASRWLDIKDVDWGGPPYGAQRYRFARRGYFGGRTQVFRPRADFGYRYDINSAYPAALVKTNLPVGDPVIVGKNEASNFFADGKEGVYDAVVTVPEMFIPPLPYHCKTRTAYPIGKFRGAWTGLELRAALDSGVEIQQMHRGIVWHTSDAILAPFCERGWNLRAGLGKKHPLAKWLKWLLNSATGKLAQNPELQTVLVSPKNSLELIQNGHEGGWEPIGNRPDVWSRTYYRMAQSGYVHWAAYLTAATRIELFDQLTADGVGGLSAVYSDTDSCYATEMRTRRLGSDLGLWSQDGRFANFMALAPKSYRYFDLEEKEVVVRAKGFPFDRHASPAELDAVWAELVSGRILEFERGVDTFKASLRSGHDELFHKRHLKRRVLANGIDFGDRKLDGEVTRPRTVSELEKMAA